MFWGAFFFALPAVSAIFCLGLENVRVFESFVFLAFALGFSKAR